MEKKTAAKAIWKSKTIWLNALSVVAMLGQMLTGKEFMPVEAQATLLAAVNVVLRMITKGPVAWTVIVLAMLMPGLMGCASASQNYFTYRVDKGAVFEGGWRKTGIIIKAPGDGLTSGSLTLGHEIGWGVASVQPMGANDAGYYSHKEGVAAGTGEPSATVGSETVVRVDQRKYLGAERVEAPK